MVRILLVDDSEFMRTYIRMVLTKAGHEIVGEATDGLECISMYESFRPDLVLLDHLMPKLRGIETLQHILAIDPHALVIMVSADGQRSQVDNAATHGASGFIVKPFKRATFLNEIQRVLERDRHDPFNILQV